MRCPARRLGLRQREKGNRGIPAERVGLRRGADAARHTALGRNLVRTPAVSGIYSRDRGQPGWKG